MIEPWGNRRLRPLVLAKYAIQHFAVIRQYCHRCGRSGTALWWDSGSSLWDEVVGGYYGAWCVECFDRECLERGILLMWRPEEEKRK